MFTLSEPFSMLTTVFPCIPPMKRTVLAKWSDDFHWPSNVCTQWIPSLSRVPFKLYVDQSTQKYQTRSELTDIDVFRFKHSSIRWKMAFFSTSTNKQRGWLMKRPKRLREKRFVHSRQRSAMQVSSQPMRHWITTTRMWVVFVVAQSREWIHSSSRLRKHLTCKTLSSIIVSTDGHSRMHWPIPTLWNTGICSRHDLVDCLITSLYSIVSSSLPVVCTSH